MLPVFLAAKRGQILTRSEYNEIRALNNDIRKRGAMSVVVVSNAISFTGHAILGLRFPKFAVFSGFGRKWIKAHTVELNE